MLKHRFFHIVFGVAALLLADCAVQQAQAGWDGVHVSAPLFQVELRADEAWHRAGWREHEWRDHERERQEWRRSEWREHEWREHHW